MLQPILGYLLLMWLKPQSILQQLQIPSSFQAALVSLHFWCALLVCLITWRGPQCCHPHTKGQRRTSALLYKPLVARRGSQDPLQVASFHTVMPVIQELQGPLPIFPSNTRGLLLKLPPSRAAHLAQAPATGGCSCPGWMSSSSVLRALSSVRTE